MQAERDTELHDTELFGPGERVSEIRPVLPRPPGLPRPLGPAPARLVRACLEPSDAPLADDAEAVRLVALLTGKGTLLVGDTPHELSTGDVLLVPAGVALRVVEASDTVETGRAPTRRGGNETAGQRVTVELHWSDPALTVQCVHDSAGRVRELLQWLLVEQKSDFDGADAFRNSLLTLLVHECCRLATDGMGALEKRVRAYVEEHISESISLDDLAREVGMGRFHLCRKYRSATGQSPMNAVRTVRMEHARELIRNTRMPLREIAKRVGLSSEQHLSRLLRLHFGLGVKDLRAGGSAHAG